MPRGTLTVHTSKQQVSWRLTSQEVGGAAKEIAAIESEEFQFCGLAGKLKFLLYPEGASLLQNGEGSLFIWVPAAALAMTYTLTVNNATGEHTALIQKGWIKHSLLRSQPGDKMSITLQVHEWLRSTEKEMAGLELTLKEKKALLAQHGEQVANLKLTLEAKEAKEALLAQQLQSSEKEVASLKLTLEAKEALLAQQGEKLQSSEQEVASLTSSLEAKETQLARREEQLARGRMRRLKRCLPALQRRWRERRRDSIASKYDAIVAFRSLSEFISTGSIDVFRAAESQLDISLALEANYRIVAVVGLFDKGKTFLINKLFGVNLPAGKLHTTQGFSFFLLKEQRMLILDSAGVQGTVSYRTQAADRTQAVQPILDAQSTESLMFEMISRIAHHMIFVVNDLTWFEQKYIAMLHQKYVNRKNQQKELIVVHNLRTTGSVGEAQQLFEQQIVQCYEGQPSHLTKLHFTANRGADVPPVQHIGICEDATEAGERFNRANCKIIMQILELKDMLGSPVLLSKLLKDEMDRLLPTFLNVEVGDTATSGQQASLFVEFVPVEDAANATSGYEQAGKFRLRSSPADAGVVMKTRGVISDLGEIIAHDITFNPIVNIYDQRKDCDLRRVVEVECPGVREQDVEWEERPNGLRLIIEKPKGIDEVSVHPVAPIRQCHGRWVHDFDFETTEGKFELCTEEIAMEHGLLVVPLRRWAQARKGRLGNPNGMSGTSGTKSTREHRSDKPGTPTPSPSPSPSPRLGSVSSTTNMNMNTTITTLGSMDLDSEQASPALSEA